MTHFLLSFALVAIAAPGSTGAPSVFAQAPPTQGGPVEPEPLEATHPRAKQAAALVALLLEGQRAAVLEMLAAQGTPGLATNPQTLKTVDAELARLAKQGYTIAEFLTGRGTDVVVELSSQGAKPTNIVIRFTTDEPHRIAGFARAMPPA